MSRYKKIANHKGIKKDLSNERYLAIKYINGREYSRKFDNLREAINWRATFHPSISSQVVKNRMHDQTLGVMEKRPSVRLNGEDLGYTFKDVWELYKKLFFPSLEKSTREHRAYKELFFGPLMSLKMVEITATLLDQFIDDQKRSSIKTKSRRYNFNDDLKCLKALLNWYRQNYDPFFVNPVLPRHMIAGIVKKVKPKNKKMTPEEVLLFFQHLPDCWRDFAETQFYLAGRVSEVAGLQKDCISFKDRTITVKYVLSWNRRTKKFDYLKELPKNGEERFVFLNDRLQEIMQRRIPLAANGFVFHDNGTPLTYRQIQHHYNHALEKAGLFPKFRSTHIMRHSMGTITRKVTGSMDAAQAVTGHKDIKTAQQYASLPSEANRHAVVDVNRFMKQLEANLPNGEGG